MTARVFLRSLWIIVRERIRRDTAGAEEKTGVAA